MRVRKICTRGRLRSGIAGTRRLCVFSVALSLAGFHAAVAHGGLEVTAVVIDGREQPRSTSGADEATAVHVPAHARSLTIRFRETKPADGEGREGDSRLRYRLDGRDDAWRDIPAAGRALLWFVDREGLVIGGLEEQMPGETPGWNGSVHTSRFMPLSLPAVAPEGASGVLVSFLSHNGERVVGCLGLDEMRLTCERPGAEPRVLPLSPLVFPGSDIRPQSRPDGWQRVGSRPELSRVEFRSLPEPHPILAIHDDDAKRYGNWTVTSRVLPETEQGDRVTLSWTSAYSFGAGGEGTATYDDLPAGDYRFRVGAFAAHGGQTGEETGVRIVVARPFHQRRDVWAAGAAGLVAAGVYAGRTIAARRMKRRVEVLERAHGLERERARIARDLHDDIGAALTEIAMQADAVRQEVQDVASPEALQMTDGICRSAVALVRNVDAIVWAVNPANDTLNRFAAYLVQSTEQFLDAAGLSMRFQVPSPLPDTSLEGTVRHRLFLTVREALNNVVKHARARSVTLSLRLTDDALTITVEDDGAGFAAKQAAAVTEQDGLDNMRNRMGEIGGTCTIDSVPGRGTRIVLRLPWPPSPGSGEAAHA